jgi:hypothetical protein
MVSRALTRTRLPGDPWGINPKGGFMESASLLMLGFVVVSAVVQTIRDKDADR